MQTLTAVGLLVTGASPALALSVAPVPEPSTLTMVALGGAAGVFLLWRKNRASKK